MKGFEPFHAIRLIVIHAMPIAACLSTPVKVYCVVIDNTGEPEPDEQDPNKSAKKAVDEITGQNADVNAEDSIADPKIREALRRAQEQDKGED